MDKLLNLIVSWIEYFRKKDEIIDKRLENIEGYLETSSETKFDEFVARLEALEKEVTKNDAGAIETIE